MTLDGNGIGGYASSDKYWNMGVDGTLTASGATLSNATIEGKITAIKGSIGGFTISDNSIENDQVHLGSDRILFGDTSSNYCEINGGILRVKGAVIDGSLVGTNINIKSTNATESSSTASIITQDYVYVNKHYQLLKISSTYVSSNTRYKRELGCYGPGNGISMGCYKYQSNDWYSVSLVGCYEDGNIDISGNGDVNINVKTSGKKTYINSNMETYSILPHASSAYNLGSEDLLWGTVYASKLCASTESVHVKTKGAGVYHDAAKANLIKFDDAKNYNNMIMIASSSYTVSIYTANNVWKNGSSTSYFATTTSSSDKRLKDYVSDLSELNDFFMDLSPIGYTYHKGLYNSDNKDPLIKWGFYAQDIIQNFEDKGMQWDKYDLVIEEMTDISEKERQYIDGTYDGILKISYENFTALNTYMIQQAYKKIAELEEKIKQLSN